MDLWLRWSTRMGLVRAMPICPESIVVSPLAPLSRPASRLVPLGGPAGRPAPMCMWSCGDAGSLSIPGRGLRVRPALH